MKVLSFLIMITLFVSCSSKKPKNSSVSDGQSDEFALNGDSDSGGAGGLQTIYFDYQSDVLSSSAKSALEKNRMLLSKHGKVHVQIEGHCDERGGAQLNLALGERRAKSVRNFLQAKGIAAKRIKTLSYGKEKPVEMGNDEDSWSKNRRANFVILLK